MAGASVTITNLREFRAALASAESATPKELTAALRAAGAPVLTRAKVLAPVGGAGDPHPGALQASYKIYVSGTKAEVASRAAYAGGAEWGAKGKWSGFLKYGTKGRFVARALDIEAEHVMEIMLDELHEIISIHGWAV